MMKTKTILVVDDEDMIVSIISKNLERASYQVITARNHKAAWKIVQETPVDMVISDVMMPYAGGFDLVEMMKDDEKTKQIPVILVTGMDKDILNASLIEADAVIQKPFDMDALLNLVKEHFQEVHA
jgi:DNA-binding response OmpR family regulator